MAFLLMRIAVTEILRPSDRKSSDKDKGAKLISQLESFRTTFIAFPSVESNLTNITENKMADFEDNPELLMQQLEGKTDVAVISYNEEAENFAVQHRVNKLKQHHRRAFELISRALKIDEEVGNKDGRTVELYRQGNLPAGIITFHLIFSQELRNWKKESYFSSQVRARIGRRRSVTRPRNSNTR